MGGQGNTQENVVVDVLVVFTSNYYFYPTTSVTPLVASVLILDPREIFFKATKL